MKWRHRRVIIIIMVILAMAVSFLLFSYLERINRYKKAVQQLAYSEIMVSQIPDGTYVGEFDADIISAMVRVVVKDGRITDIVLLEHKQERGTAGEAVLESIIEEQRINVDTVSGATNSSKVIKKAVENALSPYSG